LNNSSIPYGLAISDNGSKLIISDTLSDSVLEYSFGTAWDISTLSFVQQFSVAAQIVSAGGVYVSPDGARLYIVDLTSDDINQYGLSSPWDVSTAGYVQSHIGSSTWDSLPRGVTFRQNGLRMYVVGIDGDRVYEYSLSVAWDISTATYTQNLSVLNKDTMPEAVTFSPDGTRLFVLGRATDSVYQYNIS
jgi:DNA-binding beta-propeller fold protein YncE